MKKEIAFTGSATNIDSKNSKGTVSEKLLS